MLDTNEDMKAYVKNLAKLNPDVKAPNLTDLFVETSGLQNSDRLSKIKNHDENLKAATDAALNRISQHDLDDTILTELPVNRSVIADLASRFKVSNKSLGIAIAGLAGALALSGYANSFTSSYMPTPAETQAAGQVDQYPTQPPTLSNGNLNVMRGADNKSYVINIRADSPRGRHAAESAISQATMSTVPQNSSININSNFTATVSDTFITLSTDMKSGSGTLTVNVAQTNDYKSTTAVVPVTLATKKDPLQSHRILPKLQMVV